MSLSLSLNRKYAEARDVITQTVEKYVKDYPELNSRSVESQSTILIDHQKNYKQGVAFLEGIKV